MIETLEGYNKWSCTWNVQLTIPINFISSKYVDEERVMHPKSDLKNLQFIIIHITLFMSFSSHFVQDIKVV